MNILTLSHFLLHNIWLAIPVKFVLFGLLALKLFYVMFLVHCVNSLELFLATDQWWLTWIFAIGLSGLYSLNELKKRILFFSIANVLKCVFSSTEHNKFQLVLRQTIASIFWSCRNHCHIKRTITQNERNS